ncbi:hypothetical protein Hanom_Chr12g01079551 [Helianthus anomalus]
MVHFVRLERLVGPVKSEIVFFIGLAWLGLYGFVWIGLLTGESVVFLFCSSTGKFEFTGVLAEVERKLTKTFTI